MDAVQLMLRNIEGVVKLTEAREAFNSLIGQVNQVLQFIVTGKIDESESSCAGGCASCSGSCHLN
jgi:soluble cytochrome b562